VQVHSLLEEAASLLRASLPSGVELTIEDVPSHVAVSGEPAQLQQLILNLCTNAAHAIQRSGNIRVTAGQTDVAAFHFAEGRPELFPRPRRAIPSRAATRTMAPTADPWSPMLMRLPMSICVDRWLSTIVADAKASTRERSIAESPSRPPRSASTAATRASNSFTGPLR